MTAPRCPLALTLTFTIASGCGENHLSAPPAASLRETVTAIATSGTAVVASIHEGIARTTDQGENWTIVHPVSADELIAEGDVIFAATRYGVLRSNNSGLTWSNLETGLPAESAWCGAVARERNTLVAAFFVAGRVGVSSNLGDTWQFFELPGASVLTSVLVRNGVLYAGTISGSVFRSTDGGQNWLPA